MTKAKKDTIDPIIEAAFKDVPEIGHTWKRWYDIPYRMLWWIMRGRLKNMIPRSFKDFALKGVNNLLQFNEFDRLKRWDRKDRFHNLHVPDDEHVTIPAILTVELFTPNDIPRLEKLIKRNGWDKQTRTFDEPNSKRLAQARSRDSSSWWRFVTIVDKNSGIFTGDTKQEKLPEGISAIRLKAVQVGSGLTALVACFTLNEESAHHLDDVWHSDDHEPFMEYVSGRFRPHSRSDAAYKATQMARKNKNDEVRKWMSERCPGYFASHREALITLDVILTDKYDPTSGSKKVPDIDMQDALHALGIDVADFYRITAPELPTFALSQANRMSKQYLNSSRTWSLISKRSKLQQATENFKYQGGDENWGAAHIANERLGDTLILLAVSELLTMLEKQYSILRDTAQLHHEKFKVSNLNKLNKILLDSSLTLASIRRDVKKLQGNRRWFEGASFTMKISPFFKDKMGKKDNEPIKFHEDVLVQQEKTFARLSQVDKDYRDILATVSSVGATASTIRLTRWALIVALGSLLASAVAIIVTILVSPK